jgi:hypothetical protein
MSPNSNLPGAIGRQPLVLDLFRRRGEWMTCLGYCPQWNSAVHFITPDGLTLSGTAGAGVLERIAAARFAFDGTFPLDGRSMDGALKLSARIESGRLAGSFVFTSRSSLEDVELDPAGLGVDAEAREDGVAAVTPLAKHPRRQEALDAMRDMRDRIARMRAGRSGHTWTRGESSVPSREACRSCKIQRGRQGVALRAYRTWIGSLTATGTYVSSRNSRKL